MTSKATQARDSIIVAQAALELASRYTMFPEVRVQLKTAISELSIALSNVNLIANAPIEPSGACKQAPYRACAHTRE